MENISAFDISKLLENTNQIASENYLGAKLIKDKKITGRFVLENDKIKDPVTFSNCHFDEVYINHAITVHTIEFEYCTFHKEVDIVYIQTPSLRLRNCNFEKDFGIKNCRIQFLIFDKVESHNGINFEGGIIRYIDITPINEKTIYSFLGKFLLIDILTIRSISGITLSASKAIINNINLYGYYTVPSRLNFNNIINQNIDLNDLNNDGKIYFSHLKPVGVKAFIDNPIDKYITAFNNYEKVNQKEIDFIKELAVKIKTIDIIMGNYPIFDFKDFIEQHHYTDFLDYKVEMSTKFLINNSSAGILELKNIMFDHYKIELINSDLSAVKLINTQIPDVKSIDNYLNYYNVYNDLYTTATKQNNTKDKADYYRISQSYLSRYLKYESTGINLGSRIAISVSRLFSSHGTDWIRACLVTISIAFIFFSLFINSLKHIHIDLSWKGMIFFADCLMTFFPQFINPLHRIDFMSEISELGNWAAFYDFIARIFVSIGVFEIVRSFRKHVRT